MAEPATVPFVYRKERIAHGRLDSRGPAPSSSRVYSQPLDVLLKLEARIAAADTEVLTALFDQALIASTIDDI